HFGQVAGELVHGPGPQLLVVAVEATGDVPVFGHEVRRRVGEDLPVGALVILGELLHPPALGRIGGEIVVVRIVRVPGLEDLVPVGDRGRCTVQLASGVLRPIAVHGPAGPQIVGDVGGVLAADVVTGDVQIEAVLAEHHLVQLLAQRVGVPTGRVGHPHQTGAPSFERVTGVPGVGGDGDRVG